MAGNHDTDDSEGTPRNGKAHYCVRYACDVFAVGAELSDWQSGDFHIIREYMKPIPR